MEIGVPGVPGVPVLRPVEEEIWQGLENVILLLQLMEGMTVMGIGVSQRLATMAPVLQVTVQYSKVQYNTGNL